MKYYVTFSLVFILASASGQSNNNIVVVDTLHLKDAISAIFDHKNGQVGVIIERSDLELLRSSKNIISNSRVFLAQSGFLSGDYPKDNCEYARVVTEDGLVYQEFEEKPLFFILLSVETDHYVDKETSVDNNLNRLLRKAGQLQRVLIPRCNVNSVHGG